MTEYPPKAPQAGEHDFSLESAVCSDAGNADALCRLHGADCRYVPAWQSWVIWDEDAGVWGQGVTHPIGSLAKQTILTLHDQAATWVTTAGNRVEAAAAAHGMKSHSTALALEELGRARGWLKWLVRSQNAERVRGMVTLAADTPALRIPHEDLDAHPGLLATPSGTVDLWTGCLRPSQRKDLLTQRTAAPFDPAAKAPLWEAFLSQVTCGDEELAAYLQRIMGYCLTGSTETAFLGFFLGDGANGKSTFLLLLQEILGGYATPAPRGLLFWTKNDRHPTELAALFKKRLVICPEVPEGASLDEAKVKDLTGGDRLKVRRMREDFWEFTPTHKLIIAGNHWFFVRGRDAGIWRRIHPVPWNLQLEESQLDTQIVAKLRTELPGIFAWAVRGAVAWRRDGLREPASCAVIRESYRAELDLPAEFLSDLTSPDPNGRVASDALYDAYLGWMAEQGHAVVLPRRKFALWLRGRGLSCGTVRVGARTFYGWSGIRLATAEERAARRWGTADRGSTP